MALTPALVAEIEEAAGEEKLSARVVVREVTENRRWQRIFAYERARALGSTEEDIPRFIAESRQEQRQSR